MNPTNDEFLTEEEFAALSNMAAYKASRFLLAEALGISFDLAKERIDNLAKKILQEMKSPEREAERAIAEQKEVYEQAKSVFNRLKVKEIQKAIKELTNPDGVTHE